jgi:hypothetical protein
LRFAYQIRFHLNVRNVEIRPKQVSLNALPLNQRFVVGLYVFHHPLTSGIVSEENYLFVKPHIGIFGRSAPVSDADILPERRMALAGWRRPDEIKFLEIPQQVFVRVGYYHVV